MTTETQETSGRKAIDNDNYVTIYPAFSDFYIGRRRKSTLERFSFLPELLNRDLKQKEN
ncbi:MAG: hypothetical protein AABX03_03355 [Nanoarchaeota archaeon]